MRDRNCVKTLSFKSALNNTEFISKADAVNNSAIWAFAEPESDDNDDPPSAAPETFDKGSTSTTPLELDPPGTVEKSRKRKAA